MKTEYERNDIVSEGTPCVPCLNKKPFLTVRQLTTVGLLGGITALLGLTGYGFINLVYMKATILQIPTIIGAILEGPRVGMLIGFIFGCFSLFQNIMVPTVMSVVFLNPVISVLPRVLLGLIAYLVYRRLPGPQALKIGTSAFVTTAMNTVMVLGLTYFIYAKEFAAAKNIPVEQVVNIIIGIAIANGIPEALGSVFIVVPIVMVLLKTRRRMH